MQPDLSVVFPVYNEEENLPILMGEIARALEPTGWSYEVLAVDDGSRDRSLGVVHELHGKYPQLRIPTLPKNRRQKAPLDAGPGAGRGAYAGAPRARPQEDPAGHPRLT